MIRFALATCLFLPLALPAAESGLGWRTNETSTTLVSGDQIVWRYNYGPEDTKPSFHPLAMANGPTLTGFRPADHPWHRGLWFSWKFINGVNYWEEDKTTGKAAGRTEIVSTRVETRADFSARIVQQIRYQGKDGGAVLAEERVIELEAPSANGGYSMSWVGVFTAKSDVVLDRTPLPNEPDGKVYGGYAGLSLRLAQGFGGVKAFTSEGDCVFTDERFRGKSLFLDYAGTVDGREVGVAMLDHPCNLNTPSPWYAINGREMRFFSPAVICFGPHRMKADEKLTLRYRVILHPGRLDKERLQKEAARFGTT